MLVSLLDGIFLKYDTKSTCALSTDNSMQIRIKWMTVVSVLNQIFVPGHV
jgi:hypothetical protein